MPATITHSYFAEDVYDILPSNIGVKLDLRLCRMYAQSVDALKFYNLFSLMPGKNIRKFQNFFHNNQSQEFFINLLRYIRDNNIKNKEVYSFMYGFICHYVLDSTIHPYIVYRSGVMKKNISNTYKYNNLHSFMESYIDMDMVKRREKTNPYTFNFANYCFYIEEFSKELKNTIDYTFYNTFKIKNMSEVYYKSLKQMRKDLILFRKDSIGIKKNLYKLIDTFTPRSVFRFEAISYHVSLDNKYDFLNIKHRLWRNPIKYSLTSHESFIDLYLRSIKTAKVLICASFDYLDGKDIDLESIFTNKSYITGLDCNNKKELKYFDF